MVKELEDAQAALKQATTERNRGRLLRKKQLASAEEQSAAATNRKTRAAAKKRVDTAKRAIKDPKNNATFDTAKARVEAAQQAVDALPPATARDAKALSSRLAVITTKVNKLRKELRQLHAADQTARAEATKQAFLHPPETAWKKADRRKITGLRGRVAKIKNNLKAESDPTVKGTLAYKVAQAAEVVELRVQRDAAKETLDVFEKKATVLGGDITAKFGVGEGRLPAARRRVLEGEASVAGAEKRIADDGGPARIVGNSDPRVQRPRLYATGPRGQGLIRIPRPRDQFGDNFALLRARRKGDGWEFTHLKRDLTEAAGGRQSALIRAARELSPQRDELRQKGWRFFDEDVTEGSTRIGGEAAQARQAATVAGRPLREATAGAAEAQRAMGQTIPPKPEVPPTTYANRDELTAAFKQDIKNVKEQVTYAKAQLELVVASLYKFAEADVTVQAMDDIKALFKALDRGAAGAEGLTASARVNRWMDLHSELNRLMEAVDFERTLGVDALPDVSRRLSLLNDEIARLAERWSVDTQLENIVGDVPGLQRRVPRVSPERLKELEEKFAELQDLQSRAAAMRDNALEAEKQAKDALRRKGVQESNAAKNRAQVAKIEAGALVRQLEKETALWEERLALSRAQADIKRRVSETTKRLDREGTFIVSPKSDKDVRRLALEVDTARAKQGYGPHGEQRAPWTEGTGQTASVRERPIGEILEIATSVEPRVGYAADSVEGKLFSLNQRERKLAQEYLKAALSQNEWGPWTLSKGDPWHEQMHGVIQAFSKVNDPSKWDGQTGLWKTWDNFQTYLKAAMIATPGFVNRNIFGAFFNAWLDDVNPAEIIRSMQMTLRVAKRARKDGVGFYSAAKQLAKTEPSYRQYVELLEVGVRGGGQAVHSVELEIGLRNAMDVSLLVGGRGRAPATTVSLAPWSPRFAWFQGIRSLNSWVEDIVRLGVGMDTMRWGGNADDALRRIAKTQFDYDELTQFERTWMRRFFPFYTWTRKNVPYQLDQLARNPAKFNKILAGKRNLEMGTKEEDIVPDYFLEPFGVRTPFKYKGATVYSAPDFPFQDLARYDPFDREGGGLKEGAQNVMSMLTPILKAPLETAFGKQMYNGVPFTGRFQLAPASISKFPGMKQALQGIGWIKQSPNGEWKMRDHHIYLITNMLPTLGFLRRIAPNEPKYQRAYLRTLMSTIGGVSASFNTDEAQHNWLTNLRYERQEERQEWKDMTSQTR